VLAVKYISLELWQLTCANGMMGLLSDGPGLFESKSGQYSKDRPWL
jgi:hypothetical protein